MDKQVLFEHLSQLHTTPLGEQRIRRNLYLNEAVDVVSYCRQLIRKKDAQIIKKGKNWYIRWQTIELTINAGSYTLITAHQK